MFVCSLITADLDAEELVRESTKIVEQVTVDQWHIRLNAGAGVMTNPLHGGDNLPLVLIPEVAYYGDSWFFDNGRLGYSLKENDSHIINLVTEFNPETRFFIDFHPSNIFAIQNSSNMALINTDIESEAVPKQQNINEINKRRWALDAGFSYHYINENQIFSAQLLGDVSGVYQGYRATFQWQMNQHLGQLQFKPSVGLSYKSAQLNDYFYGLSEDESKIGAIEVGSSWQPYAKIDARWPLTEANSLRFHLAYYDYSAVDDSPLFEHTYSMTAFIGFDHIF